MRDSMGQFRERLDPRAEKSLREAEQRFRAIYDSSSDGIFLLDLETRRFAMCNKSCLRMLGYTQGEFTKLGIPDLHPEADIPFICAQIEEFLHGGKPIRHDIRFKRKDGSILLADLSPDLVRLQGRRYIAVILKDTTERARMEEELRRYAEHLEEQAAARTAELQESQRRYRSLAENDPDIIQRLDRDLRYLYVNPAFEQATGLSSDAVLGKTARELGLSADLARLWEQAAHTVCQTGESQILQFEMPTPEGRRHYEAHLVPEPAPDGSVERILAITRDTTDRVQAEETLRQLSRKDEEALRVARMGHWEFDIATGMFIFNDQYYALHGTTAREAGGYQMNAEEFARQYVHPDDAHLVQETIQKAAATADPDFQFQTEARILRANGEVRWVTVWFRMEQDALGKTTKLCGVNQDITERRRAEDALREKEYLLSESQRIGRIGSWSVDLATSAATWTEETYRLYGVSPETFVPSAEALIGLLHPDDRDAMREWIRAALAGEPPGVGEFRVLLPDGSLRTLSGRGEIIFGADNQPVRLVGTAQDITEQKQAQAALRESEERFRAAFEEGAVAMALIALDSTLLKVNSSFCRMLGYSESELVGRSFAEITHPDDRTVNLVGTQGLACGEISSFRMEKRYLRKDDAVIWADMSTASVRDAQGRPLYCVTHIQDVTDRKQAEEALRRLNERLELQVAQRTEDLRHTVGRLQQLTLELSQAEDRERKRIADILHDDVQQTLAAAKFHLNLLSSEPRSAAEAQEIVEQVKQMLKDAIEKARSLSHELSPALYQVDLTEILNWLAHHMQQKHGLIVRVEAHGPVDSSSEPLKALLYKVTQELLFNVVKHAEVSEARIRLRRLGRCIYLSVVDRGRGFDPHRLEGAAGFGLLSIRERVHLLGGQMKIKSTRSAGTRILIAVPEEELAHVAASAESGDGWVQAQALQED